MAGNRAAAEAVPGVYVIADLTENRAYVGSSSKLPTRINAHCNALERNAHHNWGLQRAFNRGHELHVTPIPVKPGVDIRAIEKTLIDEFDRGGFLMNVAKDTEAPMQGRSHSEETRRRMSEAHTGVSRPPEVVEKVRLAQTGRSYSEETIARMSEAHKGKTLSDETKAKIAVTSTGRLHTAEAKTKMSDLAKARTRSPEHMHNLAMANKSRSIPVVVDGVNYESQVAASRALGVPLNTLRRRIAKSGA